MYARFSGASPRLSAPIKIIPNLLSPILRPTLNDLGVHSPSLERETSTGVLASLSRDFASF